MGLAMGQHRNMSTRTIEADAAPTARPYREQTACRHFNHLNAESHVEGMVAASTRQPALSTGRSKKDPA